MIKNINEINKMDRNKFINWIEEKTDKVLVNVPQTFIDDPETRIYIKGFIDALDEIKLQVVSGKFK